MELRCQLGDKDIYLLSHASAFYLEGFLEVQSDQGDGGFSLPVALAGGLRAWRC